MIKVITEIIAVAKPTWVSLYRCVVNIQKKNPLPDTMAMLAIIKTEFMYNGSFVMFRKLFNNSNEVAFMFEKQIFVGIITHLY